MKKKRIIIILFFETRTTNDENSLCNQDDNIVESCNNKKSREISGEDNSKKDNNSLKKRINAYIKGKVMFIKETVFSEENIYCTKEALCIVFPMLLLVLVMFIAEIGVAISK